MSDPDLIHPVAILALILASYRGVQLLVWDSITDPVRERISLWAVAKPESKLRQWILKGIGCPYCVGVWVSAAALLSYLFATGSWGDAPWLVHGIEGMAVAGGQALLSRWDDSRD